MSSETIFYILGGLLVASALVVSLAGLRSESFPGRAFPAVLLYFVVLVLATTTFAVRGSKDEQEARAAEQASEQAGQAAAEAAPAEGGGTAQAPTGEQGGGGAAPQAPQGPGGKLAISADPTLLAFDKKTLTSKPGPVTVTFTNPAPIAHNFAVEQGGKLLGQTPLITSSTASKTIDLAPGSYTFLCTVPGHAQAGMQGTLTVK